MTIEYKWDRLKTLLHTMESAVLAYSGGVDSSILLRAASEVMGHRILAVTAVSATYPASELTSAQNFALTLGVNHRALYTDELGSEEFVRNSSDRCYHCKRELFEKLSRIAEEEGFACLLDGSNTDDLSDYRPGRRAAEEFAVRSPLIEADLSKREIRELARKMDLPVWNKPALACLSSRIPYGTRISPEILQTIELAEDVLRQFNFHNIRVRHHGSTARIEVDPAEFARLVSDDLVRAITTSFKKLGYTYICLDLEGYRTGSLNEEIKYRSQESGARSNE